MMCVEIAVAHKNSLDVDDILSYNIPNLSSKIYSSLYFMKMWAELGVIVYH